MHRQFMIGSVKLAHGLVKQLAGRMTGRPDIEKQGRLARAEGRIRQSLSERKRDL